MTNSNPHQKLLTQLQQGDARSLRHLYNMHYPALCYFARRLTGNQQEGEDIASDSFIKLWNLRANFANMANIKAFLYITTKNACLNYLKASQRQTASQKEMIYLLEEKEEFVLNKMVKAELLSQVYNEIENLPPKAREIFKMSYLEGIPTDEIARQLNVAASTVRNSRARALELLRLSLLEKKLLMAALLLELLLEQDHRVLI